MTLRELCWTYTGLSGRDVERLEEVAASMQYTADLTGADIFIDCLDRAGETAIVVAHARPSGLRSAYHRPVLGQAALREREPAVYHAFGTGMVVRDLKAVTQEDKTVRQDAAPIRGEGERVIGVPEIRYVISNNGAIITDGVTRERLIERDIPREDAAALVLGVLDHEGT